MELLFGFFVPNTLPDYFRDLQNGAYFPHNNEMRFSDSNTLRFIVLYLQQPHKVPLQDMYSSASSIALMIWESMLHFVPRQVSVDIRSKYLPINSINTQYT